MLKEDGAAFASALRGVLLVAVKHPADAAIAKIADQDLEDAVDCGTNGVAGVPANHRPDSADRLGELVEDRFNGVGDEEEDREGAEAALDALIAEFEGALRDFLARDAFDDDRDLGGLIDVLEEVARNPKQDAADEEADDRPGESAAGLDALADIESSGPAAEYGAQHDKTD